MIAIASGKGGVGKSNIAVNLCAAFAQRGLRAILLDGDAGLANSDVLCGLRPRRRPSEDLIGDVAADIALYDAPGGFRLAPGAAGTTGEITVSEQRCRDLVDRLGGSGADVLVIDCGAGLGRGVRSFISCADEAVVVTTPEPTALADAYALIKRCRRTPTHGVNRPPSLQLVVNQCTDETDARRASERIDTVARRFLGGGVALAGWIPNDPTVAEAVRAQRPFFVARPRCDASRAVRRLARALAPAAREDVRRPLGWGWRRLFRLGGVGGRNRRARCESILK